MIVDENYNVVAPTALETGKWYTFYGVTRGFNYVTLWPTYTYGKANMDVTLYVQDRELLDFEPDINIRQENHAWQGNTAPYQDAEGNWLFHYRSFTSEHHDNNGWNRRTYIDIPADYTHASFEFRFNVSQQAASGEELADRIEAFYGMSGATYADAEGNVINAKDMVVGQWYKVTFARLNYFIAMSDVGGTVNIDMDIRNVVGCNYSSDYTWGTDAGQNAAGIYYGVDNGEAVWVYSTKLYAINSSEWSRRMQLSVANTAGQNISMKVKLVSVTDANGNASTQRKLKLNDANNNEYPAAFIDENGTPVAATELELGKWYTMSWTATGAATYNIWTFTGSQHATIYMKDVVVSDAIENPFGVPSSSEINTTNVPAGSFGYYGSVTPVMVGDEVMYMHYIKSTNDGTTANSRRAILNMPTAEKTLIRMDVYFTNSTGTPSFEIRRNDATSNTIDYIVMDTDGNVCDAANLQTHKWYTLMWFAQGNTHHQIRPITGSKANGTYYIKNLTAKTMTEPFANTYYSWIADVSEATDADDVLYYGITRSNDGTGNSYRRVELTISNAKGDMISFKMMQFKHNANGTPNVIVKNASGTEMAITIFDESGNVIRGTDMQLGNWYTVSWTSDGSAKYTIHAFDGSGVAGSYLLKDLEVSQPAVPIIGGSLYNGNPYYITTSAAAMSDGIAYKAVAKVTGDGTNWVDRRVMLTAEAVSGKTMSIKVCITAVNGTPAIALYRGDSLAISHTITDAEGNVVDGNNLELNKWYTITWTTDASPTYQIRPFLDGPNTNSSGNACGANGTFYVKDITLS